jgi:hypothetical protein
MDRATRRSADGRSPVDNGTHCFDVAIHQIVASSTSSRPPGSTPRMADRHVLEADELTVLTGWAEGVAEALTYAPERAAELLDDARPGAPWRLALGIPEPSTQLSEAIHSMGRQVQAATPRGGAPTFDALLTAAIDDEADENALDGLVRRVLLSMLEERITRQPTLSDASPPPVIR